MVYENFRLWNRWSEKGGVNLIFWKMKLFGKVGTKFTLKTFLCLMMDTVFVERLRSWVWIISMYIKCKGT